MKSTLIIIFLALVPCYHAQKNITDSLKNAALLFQNKLDSQYSDSIESPLKKEERLKFKGHEFFPVDMKYCVQAKLIRAPNEKTFGMKTTTNRQPMYVKYGEVHFKLNNKKYKLNVYQSMDLLNKPEYRDYLFLPFKDNTNGIETYGGGRFMDLRIGKVNMITIDFNQAYNPYCAYNHNYSCPVPPIENTLNVEIRAGVKLKE